MVYNLKNNFIISLSELLLNLSAGWFGVILIIPGVWLAGNGQINVIIFMSNLFYGIVSFWVSVLLKDIYESA